MFIVINTYIKMANSSNEKKITWGSPFSWKGPQFHIKIGTLGSPKYYEIRDGGPRFHMKLGTRGPHFGGSPFSHDNGGDVTTVGGEDTGVIRDSHWRDA